MTARYLTGIDLRSWLVLHLHSDRGPVTVAELVTDLDQAGFAVDGRASKVISDALRWEVRRRRVQRLTRGVYRAGRLAKVTLHRMRRRVEAARLRPPGRPEPRFVRPIVAETRNPRTHPILALGSAAENGPDRASRVRRRPPNAAIRALAARRRAAQTKSDPVSFAL